MVEESRSAMKREVEALQELAIAIGKLSDRDVSKLNLPEKLSQAILDYKKMKTNGALRRQAQYLGRLMREADPEQVARWSSQVQQRK